MSEDYELITRKLPVKLTGGEFQQRAIRLTGLMADIRNAIKERSEMVSKYNGSIKEMRKDIDPLAEVVNTGVEVRDVECRAVKNWQARRVDIIRTDTNELVDSRPIEEAELQKPLPLLDPVSEPPKRKTKSAGDKMAEDLASYDEAARAYLGSTGDEPEPDADSPDMAGELEGLSPLSETPEPGPLGRAAPSQRIKEMQAAAAEPVDELDEPEPEPELQAKAEPEAPKRRGRPPGSKNKNAAAKDAPDAKNSTTAGAVIY